MFEFCVGSICPGRHLAANSVSNSDIQDEIMFNLEQIVASYHDIQYRSGIQDRKGHRTGRRTN